MFFLRTGVPVAALLLAPVCLMGSMAAPVGFATNEAHFVVGSTTVEKTATVFEGDRVRSLYFATRLNLKDGSRFVLGIGSEGIVEPDLLVLESGSVDVVNRGRASRVAALSLQVIAEGPGSAATVYLTGKNRVTVLVRSGDVKISQRNSQATTLRAGELVSWKPDSRGRLRSESDGALMEVSRVQSEQLATLVAASKDYNCVTPKVEALSRSYASAASQLAASEAARSAIQSRVNAGRAMPADLDNLAALSNTLGAIRARSAGLAADLNDVFQPYHHGPPEVSGHTTHGHQHPLHHGQHGHTVPPSSGHHHVAPHSPG